MQDSQTPDSSVQSEEKQREFGRRGKNGNWPGCTAEFVKRTEKRRKAAKAARKARKKGRK